MSLVDGAPLLHPQVNAVCVLSSQQSQQLTGVEIGCQRVQIAGRSPGTCLSGIPDCGLPNMSLRDGMTAICLAKLMSLISQHT